MLFRYLMPDCQMVAQQVGLTDLRFFAVLLPIKNTNPNITELRRLDDQSARAILNEHLLTCFAASKLFGAIVDAIGARTDKSWTQPYSGSIPLPPAAILNVGVVFCGFVRGRVGK